MVMLYCYIAIIKLLLKLLLTQYFMYIKHIEIDCHFVKEKISAGVSQTKFVKSVERIADLFTKTLEDNNITFFWISLDSGMYLKIPA